jgi:hypothetical protein
MRVCRPEAPLVLVELLLASTLDQLVSVVVAESLPEQAVSAAAGARGPEAKELSSEPAVAAVVSLPEPVAAAMAGLRELVALELVASEAGWAVMSVGMPDATWWVPSFL